MQDPVLDLLGTTLVPILGANVAAGTAGHIHLVLIGIAAVGADPNQLTIFVFYNQSLHDFKALMRKMYIQGRNLTYFSTNKCSIIGDKGLNFSVRNGKRWNSFAITA